MIVYINNINCISYMIYNIKIKMKYTNKYLRIIKL